MAIYLVGLTKPIEGARVEGMRFELFGTLVLKSEGP